MKKIEKEMVVLVVKLFRTGKLNFTYSYSPSYWFCHFADKRAKTNLQRTLSEA
ncbi:MAG: hypothetical protein HYT20_01490 [Candidatus Nealsonbacteria bacterium]|nr:hypothetical protein [Candidatus Nealsonbacteria bacterium]